MAARKPVNAPATTTADSDAVARKIALATAPAWRPQPGETLYGPTVVGVRKGGVGGEYGTYPILVVETAEGQALALHAFHTLFRNRLAEIRPMPGTVIESITYVGEKETNKSIAKGDATDKTTYHHYVITMAGDTQDEEFSWDE